MNRNGATEVMLSGLDGGNSLAFLAALGTFRIANHFSASTECQMKWVECGGAWRPVLQFSDDAMTQDKFLESLFGKLKESVSIDAFADAPDKNMKCIPSEYHAYARKLLDHAHRSGDRRSVDYAAAFGCDVTYRKDGIIERSKMQLAMGGGRQDFFPIVRELATRTTIEQLSKSLFETWRYDDPSQGVSLRLDSQDDARYAYQWRNPSGDPARKNSGSMQAANRLAVEAFPFFSLSPKEHRIETAGFTVRPRIGTFWTWPIWCSPVSTATCQSLLSLSLIHEMEPDANTRCQMGIVAVYRCQRISVNKLLCVTPAEPV